MIVLSIVVYEMSLRLLCDRYKSMKSFLTNGESF